MSKLVSIGFWLFAVGFWPRANSHRLSAYSLQPRTLFNSDREQGLFYRLLAICCWLLAESEHAIRKFLLLRLAL